MCTYFMGFHGSAECGRLLALFSLAHDVAQKLHIIHTFGRKQFYLHIAIILKVTSYDHMMLSIDEPNAGSINLDFSAATTLQGEVCFLLLKFLLLLTCNLLNFLLLHGPVLCLHVK